MGICCPGRKGARKFSAPTYQSGSTTGAERSGTTLFDMWVNNQIPADTKPFYMSNKLT